MEENKTKKEEPKKLSYEELSQAASNLHVQYQKLLAQYQKAMAALNDRSFEYTSFFLSMLFKVMEHPEMYSEDFVKWCAGNIESALRDFEDASKPAEMKGGANEAK